MRALSSVRCCLILPTRPRQLSGEGTAPRTVPRYVPNSNRRSAAVLGPKTSVVVTASNREGRRGTQQERPAIGWSTLCGTSVEPERIELPTSCLQNKGAEREASSRRSRLSTDTPKPTAVVRHINHGRDLRYRVGIRPEPALRRTADLVFTRARAAVFIDGCLWHGCPVHHTVAKSNADYWREKVQRDAARDNDHTARYSLGHTESPMAVSTHTYESLPATERNALPEAERLTAALDEILDHNNAWSIN